MDTADVVIVITRAIHVVWISDARSVSCIFAFKFTTAGYRSNFFLVVNTILIQYTTTIRTPITTTIRSGFPHKHFVAHHDFFWAYWGETDECTALDPLSLKLLPLFSQYIPSSQSIWSSHSALSLVISKSSACSSASNRIFGHEGSLKIPQMKMHITIVIRRISWWVNYTLGHKQLIRKPDQKGDPSPSAKPEN